MCDRHLVGAMLAVLLTSSATAFADVYRWDTGQLISGSEGIVLGPGTVVSSQNLEYADLRELDLTDSYFRESNLVYADFSNSDLQGADLRDAKLTHVNLTDTNVSGVRLDRSTTLGLTAEQLYSTASYKSRNLRGIGLGGNDLQGWNFAGQDLTDASISGANLTASSFDDAVIKGISLRDVITGGFTKEQLYSTSSYRDRDLRGISMRSNDLSDWDFSSQDLTESVFIGSRFERAEFSNAILVSTSFNNTRWNNATLSGADLSNAHFEGVNFSHADLSDAVFVNTFLHGVQFLDANLAGANFKNTDLTSAYNLSKATFSSETVYSQWTVFPDGFDPVLAGLTLESTQQGDFNGDGILDADDANLLIRELNNPFNRSQFDLDNNGTVAYRDFRIWVTDLASTRFGDANLDGEFNSRDLVLVFQANQYEDAIPLNSTWQTGDWDGDREFTSGDLVFAFEEGSYEAGPRAATQTVPEPNCRILFTIGVLRLLLRRRRATRIAFA